MTESRVSIPSLLEKPARLMSLDAYRGFVMLAMVSDGLGISRVAENFPGNRVWEFLDYQLSHVQWGGCSAWDLIQPSFTFMVGVAMPYSHASRITKGQKPATIAAHVIYRALVLVLLGVFLRSNGSPFTRFTFEDVLSQIGLGYAFVYLVLGRGLAVQASTLALILGGYWLAFALYPLPDPGFDFAAVGVTEDWGPYTGFFAHWNKNTNPASAFDVWFLNLFPWPEPWRFNGGGYQTLSFIPSMGTMILGLMAGEFLRGPRHLREKAVRLFAAALVCLAAGWCLGSTVCPIVKRIWTPSWTLFSAGWTFALLGSFFWIIEVADFRKWAFPLVVAGMNSIAMYVMVHLMDGWILETLKTHLGQDLFAGTYGLIGEHLAVLLILWMICWWMYRRKIFIRI
jgi:predicted acyltransferase